MAIDLASYKDGYKGRTCILIGNGPSLRRMDLSFLPKYITFGLNKIWLLKEFFDYTPDFVTCTNRLILEQSRKELIDLPAIKFIADKVKGYEDIPNLYKFKTSLREPFSKDITESICEGSTVTYVALQIIYYMGFSTVFLIGVDHSFSVPAGAKPNEVLSSPNRPDPNHFSENYFADGYKWQAPDLANSERYYQIARQEFIKDRRLIIDCTLDGKLTVFPKMPWERLK